MGRSPCCDKDGLKKGPWTPEEDNKLIQYIQLHGPGNWRTLPKNAGLHRCGKSCRLRWTNYLRPDIKRGRFSFEEEETIIQLHSVLGNKWSAIAARLPGRTDNEIKNYWNTHIRKRLLRHGIDPVTHAPRLDLLDLSSLLNSPQALNLSNLLRLQTLLNPEALRLAMSLISPNNNNNNQDNTNPDVLLQENQLLNSLLQLQNQVPADDHFQPNQFENVIYQQMPSSNINTTNSLQDQTHYTMPNQSCQQGQVFQQNPTTTTTNIGNDMNVTSFKSLPGAIPNIGYGADLSENSSFQSHNSSCSNNSSHNYGFDSASAGLINTGEDEKESFCSNLLRFEIPESLDFDDFM